MLPVWVPKPSTYKPLPVTRLTPRSVCIVRQSSHYGQGSALRISATSASATRAVRQNTIMPSSPSGHGLLKVQDCVSSVEHKSSFHDARADITPGDGTATAV